MSFLNANLLFGLSAVSIPVLIHLFNSRKITRVTWAAMRFLKESVEVNRRRLRIEDLLLLLLRCALLALLAVTLARPVIGGVAGTLFGGGGATTAVVIVDSSYSMSQTDGARSAFERAKEAAAELIDGLPTGSKVAMWTSSDAVNPLIAEPTSDLALAHATIADATRTDRATDFLPAFRRAVELLRGASTEQKEIDLFTDGQASGWKQLSDIRQLLTSAADAKTNIVFINTPAAANLAVSQLRSVGELMLVNRPVRFSTTVTNTGAIDVHDVRVTLRVDGGEPVADAVLSWDPALSADGVDELVTVMMPRIAEFVPRPALPGRLAVHAVDTDRRWVLAHDGRLVPDEVDDASDVAATLSGPASGLFALLWRRARLDADGHELGLRVDGDPAVVDALFAARLTP